MEFRVLGSMEVLDADGLPVTPASGRLRALLALMLLHANEAVTAGRMIEGLWGEEAPLTATKVVQNLVSQLRKTLPDRLETRGHSYVLHVEPGELDLERFQALVEQAHRCRASHDLEAASAKLGEAIALWRGPALADLSRERLALPEADWLEELRLTAVEERASVDLELGRGAELVGELEQLVREQPLRERLRGALMLALYRAGRQADALDAYRRGRASLVEQLGIEPGEELRRLEQAILRHDPELDPPHATPKPATAGERAHRPGRRHASVVVGISLLVAAAVTAAVLELDHGAGAPVVRPDSVAVVDPGSGRVLSVIPVGSHPDAIAIGDGAAWVANADDGTLTRIDLTTRKVVSTIGIGGPLADVATDVRSVWVATGSEGTLVEVDPHTNAVVSRLNLGSRDALMPASADSVATGAAAVWIGSSAAGGTVFRLDPASTHAVPVFADSYTPAGVVVSGGSVWIARTDGGVARLGAGNGAVTARVDEPPAPVSIAAGDGSVWVGEQRSFSGPAGIWQFEPTTATVVRTVQVVGTPLGIATGDGAVWVAGGESGVLSELDARRGIVIRSLRLGHSLLDVAYAAGAVWVAVGDGATG